MSMRNIFWHGPQQTALKKDALIVAGSQFLSNKIATLLSEQVWLCDCISTHSMIGQAAESVMNHRHIIVVNHYFRKSFSSLLIETCWSKLVP